MECTNTIPTLDRGDVVVCGGGPAGVAAALASARLGARTILLEQTGCCGGMATGGLVPAIIHLSDRKHWIGSGLPLELIQEMCRRMGVDEVHPIWQHINPEIFKRLLDEKLAEAGVELFLALKLAAAECRNGRVVSVLAAGCAGLRRIEGRVFVDATGDGLLSMLAGAPFECGDEAGRTMSPTLCVQYSNIDLERMRSADRRGEGASALWFRHKAEIPLEEYHIVGVSEYGNGTGSGNLGHVYGINAVEERDRTRGYVEGRRVAGIIHDFYRRFVPGYEKSDLTATAALLGIRESRRIGCDYRLSLEDYQLRRHFDDDIGVFCYPIDIHASSTNPAEQKAVERRMAETAYSPGENYGIPYRALTVRNLENLLVAGRCISCDRAMQSSIRIMTAAMITGRAAGTAAALCSGGRVRELATDVLRRQLLSDGAFLPVAAALAV